MKTKAMKFTELLFFSVMVVIMLGMLSLTASAAADLTVTIDKGTEVILRDSDSDGYYEIATADELYAFAAAVIAGNNKINIELTADITVNENVVIENELNTDSTKVSAFRSWPVISSFNGTVDGGGYTISGLYFSDPSASSSRGFIGYTYSGTIKKLNIADSYMHGNAEVGLLVGSAGSGASVIHCKTSGIVKGTSDVGGMIGYMYNSLTAIEVAVDHCENSATVTATENDAGGIIGESRDVVMQNCRNTGAVTGTNYVGGIAGTTYNTDTVKACVNLGKVDGAEYVGGIAGYGSATITECINQGTVNGTRTVGGIAGMTNYSVASFSYNEGNVSGETVVGGIVGSGSAENCYNVGSVIGNSSIGGVTGYVGGSASVRNCYNIGTVSGTSKIGSVVGEFYGTVKNSYYLSTAATVGGGNLSDAIGQLEAKTAAEFASGEVAFHLTQSLEDGSEIMWSQMIDGGQKDVYPVFGTNTVYRGYNGCDAYYSNTLPEVTAPSHSYSIEGFCTIELNDGMPCGAYQPASLVDGVYQIGNAGQLYWFAAVVNSGYGDTLQNVAINGVLTDDIYINKEVLSNGVLTENTEALLVWTPIGTNSVPYTGSFDGGQYTVSGIYINGDNDYIGFFGNVGEGAYIHDMTLADSYIKGNTYVGGIAGKIYRAEIGSCHSSATIEAVQSVGSIVGYAIGSSVEDAVYSGRLFAQNRVGGIVGYMYLTDVIGCGNIGYIEVPSASSVKYAGGIVGYTYNSFNNNGEPDTNVIENCYALGTIKGGENARIGGIASACGIIMKNCFSGATIESKDPYASALTHAILNGGSVVASYYDNTKIYRGVRDEENFGSDRGRNTKELATGEIAYLLGSAWGQKIGTDAYPVLGGDTVYAIEGTSCIGTPSGTYIYSNDANAVAESGVHRKNAYNYCEFCEVKITGASIVVASELTMKYYIGLYDTALVDTANGQKLAMQFTMNGKTVTVYANADLVDGEYVFEFENIAPQQMADLIDATLIVVDENGETVKTLAEKKGHSVKANAEELLELYSTDQALVQLVTDMLTYGAAAQNYKDYNLTNLANADVTAIGTPSEDLPTAEDNVKSLVTAEGVTLGDVFITAANVWFDHVNRIGMKLNAVTENTKLVVKVGNDTVGTTYDNLTSAIVYTDAIGATGFEEVYTFELYEGETLLQTLTYSVSSYVYAMMDEVDPETGDPTEMAQLAMALYRYGASACAYANGQGA